MNHLAMPRLDAAAWSASTHAGLQACLVAGANYLPERIADNAYFASLSTRPEAWFERATGIRQRRRAGEGENANTMAIEAVGRLRDAGCPLEGVDLVVAGSYTPWDTVGTMAHAVQQRFALSGAKAIYLSTACSSFINALEIASAFFDSGRARRALIVVAEHNSLYADDADEQSGHLWGDAASAVLLDACPAPLPESLRLVDVDSAGLADLGAGPAGVYLQPRGLGLVMPQGRDVFQHACREMERAVRKMLERHELDVGRLRLIVPHQANDRIISHVAERLGASDSQVARTVGELGNTGCASTALTLLRHRDRLAPGDHAMLVTFGGGYSMGCALFERVP